MKHLPILCIILTILLHSCQGPESTDNTSKLKNLSSQKDYSGKKLNQVAFPLGGMGAGMICIEGAGALSHVSLRHIAEMQNQPVIFSALHISGYDNATKVLEGPVPAWKLTAMENNSYYSGGGGGKGDFHFGLPRFSQAEFTSRFPFAFISLQDNDIPMEVEVTAWSPFIPGDADNSSLPVAGIEYTFKNTSNKKLEAIYSFHSKNFMKTGGKESGISAVKGGFRLWQNCEPDKPELKGDFIAQVTGEEVITDLCWFRGGWFDPLTMAWKNIESDNPSASPEKLNAPGASLYVPFNLRPGESKTIRLALSWFVPHSTLSSSLTAQSLQKLKEECSDTGCCGNPGTYEPWYYSRFGSPDTLNSYWLKNQEVLRKESLLFSETFYRSDLPSVVLEAVAANLSILKSPTILRQKDGRLWGWEGCFDNGGCCPGSCTHVWNYAQAIPSLFPNLERTLRETEFLTAQDSSGHQTFRVALPISEPAHTFHAAADGQLGGIVKVYRDWRISGDSEWMKRLLPDVKKSLDYCIETWDPRHRGVLEEPHHNTYDIEFWGPDGMCSSFYHSALQAFVAMGTFAGTDVKFYQKLLSDGIQFTRENLFNGKYFYQKVMIEGLNADDPSRLAGISFLDYSEEALDLLKKEGPKYQYGSGCLSDGVLGYWLAEISGLTPLMEAEKISAHLESVYRYNFKSDLSDHVNPQRPGYATGNEGGLLLCTWPEGGMPSLPFVYSNEVWTGIEYQAASHLFLHGKTAEGLDIIKACRERYDGNKRNPFDEFECGHFYARAMASYALLQGMSGLRYDNVDKKLYMSRKLGSNYRVFISTATGYGMAGLKYGKPFAEAVRGVIEVKEFIVTD